MVCKASSNVGRPAKAGLPPFQWELPSRILTPLLLLCAQ